MQANRKPRKPHPSVLMQKASGRHRLTASSFDHRRLHVAPAGVADHPPDPSGIGPVNARPPRTVRSRRDRWPEIASSTQQFELFVSATPYWPQFLPPLAPWNLNGAHPPFPVTRTRVASSAFDRGELTCAVAEASDGNTHSVEHRDIQVRQRSFVAQTDVPARFDGPVGLAGQQDGQVAM